MSEVRNAPGACTMTVLLALVAGTGQSLAEDVSVRDLPDPMAPPPKAAAALPQTQDANEPVRRVTYRLQGVKMNASHRSAVINGQMVSVGDVVDGATVVSIESDTVMVQSGEDPITLKLLRNEVKQRSHVAQ